MSIADKILLAAALFHAGIKETFNLPWELGVRILELWPFYDEIKAFL